MSAEPAPAAAAPRFSVKELVEVARRTMPGMNKEGGAARIQAVNDERSIPAEAAKLKDGSAQGKRTTPYTYDVKYVMGGTEKRVDARWITGKTLQSRSELSEERADDMKAKAADRCTKEADDLKAEEARTAARKKTRDVLVQRRAKKAAADAKKAADKAAPKTKAAAPSKAPEPKRAKKAAPERPAAGTAAENAAQEYGDVIMPAGDPRDDDDESPAENDSPAADWLEKVIAQMRLANRKEEFQLDAVLEAANADEARPGGKTFDDESIKPLFEDLDERNVVMLDLADRMVYII
ncbi:hypothetical protein M885DRAFT_515307 [Pelagophyceae sp. CCMP2097]|nr:hypothetical protein M885DRAFT_515307 [Pelagophyceae sp. CCMP2097]|mmetsp:Transcript_33461/g.117258  ORF Transcript_33461/g.117258 Transcript_33461/m.117258 type:complete len:294 (-) Transcript_33461:277-1158(-)